MSLCKIGMFVFLVVVGKSGYVCVSIGIIFLPYVYT